MTLTTRDQLDAIRTHSAGLAEAARGRLDRPVRHCPGWTVADLVAHVTDVHWFWRTIAGELLSEPPDATRRPARATPDLLVETFLAGADALVTTLGAADQAAGCWTWAPGHQDVAFVTRHQVQEAAVHHWDAADAAGMPWRMDDRAAYDAAEEFLTVSVSSEADPAEPARPALDGTLRFELTGARDLVVTDGPVPGTLGWHRTESGVEAATGATTDPSSLLLWLYRRSPDTAGLPAEDDPLVQRFRALCFTD
jgi:uncharacterized protein (TIGR03083 family)